MLSQLIKGMSTAALIAAIALATTPAGLASDDDFQVDTSRIGHDDHGIVTSGQILELGLPSANGMRIEGENYLRMGHLDQAMAVLQRGVEMAPNDVEIRILYATALEKKLLRQPRKTRDPALYNYVVKQWLCVAKSSEFLDHRYSGYEHLIKLTGTSPKKREKEKKFLERVLIAEDGSEPVVIGVRTAANTQKSQK